ncbi:WD40 repeat domain-containing protein [Paenibacillus dakarensis]|uniref:WD40 repeat domain-containing protein n=1 Tax=Paenibacillus dakarensis TaxID=1527293 RepID=UPI0006D5380D|nr:WD40 repeat domain-containing protein [Paenibacillus dakarensis]
MKRGFCSILLSISLAASLLPPALASAAGSPLPEAPAPIVLGEAVQIPLSQGASFGQRADGTNEQYIFVAGVPGTFYAVELETGERIFEQVIPGADVVTAVHTAPDGRVYFSGGQLMFRYDPEARQVTELGPNPTNSQSVWELESSPDGKKIYGATYPDSKVFEFDVESETFRDLGTMMEGQMYARGIGVTEDYIYVGIGSDAYLIRYDIQTGEKVRIPIPNEGEVNTIADVQVYGGKLLVRSGSSTLYVLDQATNTHIRTLLYDSLVSPPSPHQSELIYYKRGTAFYSYNLENDEVALIEGIPPLPMTAFKAYTWVTLNEGPDKGQQVLAAMAAYTETMLYNPVTGSFRMATPQVDAKGVEVQAMEMGPGGKLYISGFQRGLTIFDTNKQSFEATLPSFHQTEGMGIYKDKMYFGTYGGAVMYRHDPDLPLNYLNGSVEGNPNLAYDIQDNQDRPFIMEAGDNKLFIGTFPGYGLLGGALTVLEEDVNGEVNASVHRNVVQDQSIVGVAYRDGKVYGGTSITGGFGSTPAASEAKWFVWDVASASKLSEHPLSIPGLSREARVIGDLEWGPDGLLWGAADVDGVLFAIDPDTETIVKSKRLTPGANTGSMYRPFFLRWGQDGLLYTTAGRQLFVVDTETMESKILVNEVSLAALGPDGSIYYTQGPNLFKLPYVSAESDTLASVIEQLAAAGKVKQSLKQQLVNTLKTAKQNKERGRADQAAKHYGKFLSILQGSKEQDINASAKQQLQEIAAVIAPKYGL